MEAHLPMKVGKRGITLYQCIIPVIAIKVNEVNLIGYRAACLTATILFFLYPAPLTAQVNHKVNVLANNQRYPLLSDYACRVKQV